MVLCKCEWCCCESARAWGGVSARVRSCVSASGWFCVSVNGCCCVSASARGGTDSSTKRHEPQSSTPYKSLSDSFSGGGYLSRMTVAVCGDNCYMQRSVDGRFLRSCCIAYVSVMELRQRHHSTRMFYHFAGGHIAYVDISCLHFFFCA